MKSRNYIFRKVLRALFTSIGVTFIAFLILHLAPGDPIKIMLGPYATKENVEALRTRYSLDKPLYIQYFTWIKTILTGDLGTSIRYNRPVNELIKERMGPTLVLTGFGLLVAIVLGILFGTMAALKKNSILDYITTFQTMFWLSVPSFWLAIVFLYIFGLKLRWVPIAGMTSFSSTILPIMTIGLRQQAWFARPMRAEMLEVLSQNYIKALKAKGLKYEKIIWRHAFKNALIPIITMIALQLPWIIGGAVVIEVVFSWGGMGSLLVGSVLSRDYQVVQAILLIISLAVVAANLIADILYAFIDPRIRVEG